MVTLYSSLAPVKPDPARPFGKGLIRSLPTHRAGYTASDWAWYTAESRRRENARFDAMAADSADMDRIEAGLCG